MTRRAKPKPKETPEQALRRLLRAARGRADALTARWAEAALGPDTDLNLEMALRGAETARARAEALQEALDLITGKGES